MLDEGAPLFLQIAERLAEEIVDGVVAEGQRAPSSNELAVRYRINPATAARGIGLLFDDGLLEKCRGIGMFVTAGARERLLETRRRRFAALYITPMVAEAARLGIEVHELTTMIQESADSKGGIKV